jgi:hypothetical protein
LFLKNQKAFVFGVVLVTLVGMSNAKGLGDGSGKGRGKNVDHASQKKKDGDDIKGEAALRDRMRAQPSGFSNVNP